MALDIGSSKVCALISTPDATGKRIEVIGLGIAESDGIRRGVIVNIDKTVKAINDAVHSARQQCNYDIDKVTVGISGEHIKGSIKNHVISSTNLQKQITEQEVSRLMLEASRMPLPADRRIIHLFPQQYFVDDQDGGTDPIGMSGVRLEAQFNVITSPTTSLDNVCRCLERTNIQVENIILNSLASSYAVLQEDEKEVGTALIDIGAGTSEIIVYVDNIIRHTEIIAFGGDQLTSDIKTVLGVVKADAERLKREHGHCFVESMHRSDELQVPGIAGSSPKRFQRKYLAEILESRMAEIMMFANLALEQAEVKNSLKAGIVLTGGTSLLPGIEQLAASIFRLPVRLGFPKMISSRGLAPEAENPIYSTAVGLAMYSFEKFNENLSFNNEKKKEEEKIKEIEKEHEQARFVSISTNEGKNKRDAINKKQLDIEQDESNKNLESSDEMQNEEENSENTQKESIKEKFTSKLKKIFEQF